MHHQSQPRYANLATQSDSTTHIYTIVLDPFLAFLLPEAIELAPTAPNVLSAYPLLSFVKAKSPYAHIRHTGTITSYE